MAAAEADLLTARSQLQKTLITAPFAGVVTAVDVEAGETAAVNAAVISMINADTLQIESFIPEIHVALLANGDPAAVTLDAYGPDVVFDARVVFIDPAETVRDGVSTYRAILQFSEKDSRIRAGMTANVVITTDQKSGILSVPQGIIQQRDGKKYVQVKDGEMIIEREVETGGVSSFGDVEITAGLSEGDAVILSQVL